MCVNNKYKMRNSMNWISAYVIDRDKNVCVVQFIVLFIMDSVEKKLIYMYMYVMALHGLLYY